MKNSNNVMVVTITLVLAVAGMMTTPATAVVLPQEISQQLQQRFDAFTRADGYSEVDLSAFPGDDWYTPARFPILGSGQSGVFRPDHALDPVTRLLLFVAAREGTLPHVRYRITYRLAAAPPPFGDVRHTYVEITRFNLGPALHQELLALADGKYPVAPKKVFGIGPHLSWRFVTRTIQGLNAAIVRAGRKQVSAATAQATDCLGVSCLSLTDPKGPAGDWQKIASPALDAPVYDASGSVLPGPPRVAESLFARVTRGGHEPAFGAFAKQPQMVFVISKDIEGQAPAINGLLHQPHVMDDATGQIWTRRLQVGPDVVGWHMLTSRH